MQERFWRYANVKYKVKEFINIWRRYMDTIKLNSDKVLLVAHRGLSGLEAENTNAAFIAAGNRSYFGVETDIRKTKDGMFVVNHDGNLKRVGGHDKIIEETDYDVLKELVLYDKQGGYSRDDLRVTTLESYVNICKTYEKKCIIELKTDFPEEDIGGIIDVIRECDYLDSCIFISFFYDPLLRIRRLLPMAKVQYLFREITAELRERLIKDRIDVDIKYTGLTKKDVDIFHENGLEVNCWTVDDIVTAEMMIDMGVDYITTNILE